MNRKFDGEFNVYEKVILERALDDYVQQKKRDMERCPVPEITAAERRMMIRYAERLKTRFGL